MATYHYLLNGQPYGPIEQNGLDALVAAGTVEPDILIWTEGMADWQSYSAVFGPVPSPESYKATGVSKHLYKIAAVVGLLVLLGVTTLVLLNRPKVQLAARQKSPTTSSTNSERPEIRIENKDEALKALKDGLTRHLINPIRAKNRSIDKLGWEPLIYPRQLTNQQQLAFSSAGVTNFLAVSSSFVEQTKLAPVAYQWELRTSGLSPSDQTLVAEAFERLIEKSLPLFEGMQKVDKDASEALFQMINDYKAKWGKWYKYGSSVRFTDRDLETHYLQFLKKFDAIADRETALKQELIKITAQSIAIEGARLTGGTATTSDLSQADTNSRRSNSKRS